MEPKNPEQLKKRERFIQIAGVLLMLSPICNFLLSVYFLDTVNNKWTAEGLSIIIRNTSVSHLILWASSFIVGGFMLKGRRKSWIPVLAVLGMFIVFNFWNLKKDLQRSTVRPFILLLTNMSIFGLVYSQEFHQSTQPRKKPEKVPPPKKEDPEEDLLATPANEAMSISETPAPREYVPDNFVLKNDLSDEVTPIPEFVAKKETAKVEIKPEPIPEPVKETFKIEVQEPVKPEPKKKPEVAAEAPKPIEKPKAKAKKKKSRYTDYVVHVSDLLNKTVEFEGHGPWARITEANLTELHMEAIGPTPPDIERRRVEIVLRDNKVLKLKMSRQNGPKYIFIYRDVAQKTA